MSFITRRAFLKGGVALGAASMVNLSPFPRWARAADAPDLAVVSGKDPFQNTVAALAAIGGMERFVPKGANVGLLINSPFANPGTHVNPDVALAVVSLCRRAGAGRMVSLKGEPDGYWSRGTHYADLKAAVAGIDRPGADVTRPVPGGKALKKARVVSDLFDCDVFINVSVVKHHEGTNFSGVLKNMMGAAPHSTCRYFHTGAGGSGWYGNLDHTHQCIADINRLRSPDLVVIDATAFIMTNGPFGPGKLGRAGEVIAGTDPVLADAYICRYLDLDPADVGMIPRAAAAGLGRMDVGGAAIDRVRL